MSFARIGPWAHGEVRNGGFPDWLLAKGPTLRNDPVYMSYVAMFYSQIGEQLHGLLRKHGGPVIGAFNLRTNTPGADLVRATSTSWR